MLFAAAGLATAALLGSLVLVLAAAVWGIALLYNMKFKEMGLFGNLTVAFCVAMTVIIGGAAIGVINGIVLTFAALAFLFDLGEEIASDAMDVIGDELRSSKSIARRKNKALRSPAFWCDIHYFHHAVLSSVCDGLAWIRLSAAHGSNGSMHIVFFLPASSEQYHRRRAGSDSPAVPDQGDVCCCIYIDQSHLTAKRVSRWAMAAHPTFQPDSPDEATIAK